MQCTWLDIYICLRHHLVFVLLYILSSLSCRVYLGLALSLQKDGPKERLKECVAYFLEGMEVLLTDLSKQAATPEENMLVHESVF